MIGNTLLFVLVVVVDCYWSISDHPKYKDVVKGVLS